MKAWKAPVGPPPDDLVRLAGAFAEELAAAGGGDELGRRAREFDSLTAAGGSFDSARKRACSYLNRASTGLYLPDHSVVSPGVPRRGFINIDPGGSCADPPSAPPLHPNYIPKVRARWADRERTRWDLEAALRDVEAILALNLSPRQKALFGRWREEAWRALLRSDQGHLFGSFLLAACQKAVDPATARPGDYEATVGQLAADPARFATAITDAAEYLCHPCGQAPQPPPPGPAPAAAGYLPLTEPPPPDFKLGPIAGTLTYLAKLICPLYGYEADRRALKRLHESGAIWVQRVGGRSYKVLFKEGDRPIYAQANAQDLEMKRQQRARNEQEATN